MSNINIECEDDNYYDEFIEESSPRTNYGEGYKTEKMKDEYIIINKTAIQKEKEELKRIINKYVGYSEQEICDKIDDLLSKSTPLIPEIRKAYWDAINRGEDISSETSNSLIQDYISNLKLNL